MEHGGNNGGKIDTGNDYLRLYRRDISGYLKILNIPLGKDNIEMLHKFQSWGPAYI